MFKKIKIKNKYFSTIILIILILANIIIFHSNWLLFNPPLDIIKNIENFVDRFEDNTDINIQPLLSVINSKIFHKWFIFIDEINIFKLKKDLLDGELPVYNIKFSSKDVEHFKEISETAIKQNNLNDETNNWKNAELEYNGKLYDVELKLHGDTATHWDSNLKSYKVKINDESINNLAQFNLIILEDRMLYGKVTQILAEEMNLANIRDDIVVLKINNVVQGLYYLQEKLDQDFLERNQYSNSFVIKTSDNRRDDHSLSDINGLMNLDNGHIYAFDYEISNLHNSLDDELNSGQVKYQINNLYEAINNKNIKDLTTFFDLNQITSFEAARTIIGEPHMVSGDNLQMIYDGTSGKFEPILINELLNKLEINEGGFETTLNKGETWEITLFYLLNQDDEIRHERNKKLYALSLKKDEILDKINFMIEKYLPYAVSYKTNNFNSITTEYLFRINYDYIKYNLELIKKNLEHSTFYINGISKDNEIRLKLMPESIAETKINKLLLYLEKPIQPQTLEVIIQKEEEIVKQTELVIEEETSIVSLDKILNNIYFSTGINEEFKPIKRDYEIIITSNEELFLEKIETEIINDISNQNISEGDIYIQIAKGNRYYDSKNATLIMEESSHLNWKFYDNKLTLQKGEYVLNKTLIIPQLTEFNIEEGTKIYLDDKVSLISYSPVNIFGTNEYPVIITALNPEKPFGTFGILGDNTKKSIINYLDLSYGNESWINGVYFSGGLSIHHMNVDLKNSQIHNNKADDGLNIKYGEVNILDSKFYDNFADQIDLDFCTGIVKNSRFHEGGGDENGDGLDISGSKVLVINNEFSNFQDKGLSIGEQSKIIVYDNIISNNNNGAAVKDSSVAYFINNLFKNNIITINSYQKKQLFNGGQTFTFNNIWDQNINNYQMDKKSTKQDIIISENKFTKLKKIIISEDIDNLFNFIEGIENES